MGPEILQGIVAQNKARVANVKEDQLGDASTCAEWKVKDLVNHMIAGNFMFGTLTKGDKLDRSQPPPDFVSQGNYAETFNTAADMNIAGWSTPGVMDTPIELPFGTMPGKEAIRIALLEQVVHGWDLAKATGQDTEIPEQLAAPMLDGVKKIIPPGVRPEQLPFGPEVTVPDSASTTEKLVAYLGRQP
jgi:uncharacterized protein (TIGR03086 family)